MSRFECWSDDRPGIQVAFVEEPTPAEAAEAYYKEWILHKDTEEGVEVIVSTEDGEVRRYQVETIITVVSKMKIKEKV